MARIGAGKLDRFLQKKPIRFVSPWRVCVKPFSILCQVAPIVFSMTAFAAEGIQPDLLYHNYCSVCHGDKGDGNSRARNSLKPPPRDFTRPGQVNRDAMVQIVTHGKPGTAMVGWKTQLSAAEIDAVVDYVRERFVAGESTAGMPAIAGVSGIHAHGGRAAMPAAGVSVPAPATQALPSARVDMSLPYIGGLTGAADRGKAFYDGNCATCHGVKGDGQGPRAYFIRPVPRDFLSEAARMTLNRPALQAAISAGRLGTEMPAWSKVIDEQQIVDVAEYVFQSFILPTPASARSE